VRERLYPGRAVDRDHGSGVSQHRFDIAAIDDNNALPDAVLRRGSPRHPCPIDEAVVERVQLGEQPRLGRCMPRERPYNTLDRWLHAAQRRVETDLVVAVELKREEEDRIANAGHRRASRPHGARRAAARRGGRPSRRIRSTGGGSGACGNADTSRPPPAGRPCT
jgi:hypothetical protein